MPIYEVVRQVEATDIVAALGQIGAVTSIRYIAPSFPGETATPLAASTNVKATAAQIRASIRSDALISFEDGKPYKTLKRHVAGAGLTLAEYREKWGLPSDYPSVAPEYSARRSAMAKSAGLGRKT